MRKASKRAGILASFAVAVAAIVAGAAVAATSVNAVAYRLNATLTPSQVVPAVQAPAGAVGHFHGVLIRSGIGATRVASLAGCKVVQAPRRSGLPTKLNCAGANVTLPGTSGQWRLFWKLSVSGLSGPATAAHPDGEIRGQIVRTTIGFQIGR